MAWGPRGGKGVEDLVQRLESNDADLTSLNIFPTRKFGQQVCTRPSAERNALSVVVVVVTVVVTVLTLRRKSLTSAVPLAATQC